MEIRAQESGPIFDGRAAAAVRAYQDAAEREIAQQGANDVRAELDQVLRHPTGYYERHITTDRQRGDSVVYDSGVIYGPWLEGVGSRNRTTRFKGYFTFRRTVQTLRGKATGVAERVLRRYLDRMR